MDFVSLSSILSLTTVALVVLMIEAFIKKSEAISYWLTVFGLLATMAIAASTFNEVGTSFNNMIKGGGFANFFGIMFSFSALLTVVFSREYLQKSHNDFGEFYLLILFAMIGMMLMASAADLMVIFLGLELMSICLYILAGFFRKRMKSNESSLKYFLLGAFATGFLLYGIALIYGSSGSTNIAHIVEHFSALASSKLFWTGLGLLLVGFAFKVAAAPFHMWVPDVYEGSPTTVSGFMSTGAKAAAFAALLIVFAHPFYGSENLTTTLSLIAAVSMIIGNVVAISQTNIKRMLAYSSIAHAGYMLAGLAAANQLGRSGIVFYLFSYTFMNLGAFGIVSLLEKDEDKNISLDDYAGLAKKKPALAALMAIFMFSLSGIPPFAGFFGKYYVFAAAINANLTWLAILGVLTSVIGVYYYLRIVVLMYFQDGDATLPNAQTKMSLAALSVAALAIIHFGIFPSSILTIINSLF